MTTVQQCTKEWSWNSSLHYTQKINSKEITQLNLRAESTKLLEKNIRKNLHDLGWGNSFLDNIPRAIATKGKTEVQKDKLDLSSLVL